MTMSIVEAADALLSSIQAPNGTVNILPLHDQEGDRLVVWVDQAYFGRIASIPSLFQGFPVIVEIRPVSIAYRH